MKNEHPSNRIQIAKMMLTRLERLSADSVWQHRSSGVRGSMIKFFEKLERKSPPIILLDESEQEQLTQLMEYAHSILKNAASEIPDPEERKRFLELDSQ